MSVMTETHWTEIRDLEDELDKGDITAFIKFIKLLNDNKLMNRHMWHSICECHHKSSDNEDAWVLLHQFAKDNQIWSRLKA